MAAMNGALQSWTKRSTNVPVAALANGSILQRRCACGGGQGPSGQCEECRRKGRDTLQRHAASHRPALISQRLQVPAIVHDVLRSAGEPLDTATRAFMESRFSHDFSQVRVHTGPRAAESSRAVNALAYTVGRDVVFAAGQYAPRTEQGRRLLAHELTHTVQQAAAALTSEGRIELNESPLMEHQAEAAADTVVGGRGAVPIASSAIALQRRAAPYIKKVTVHLDPLQSADLEWEGMPPADAPGSDHFTVSTGKGYSDPGDPPGTCTRDCCRDALTQCAPPWNQPGRVGACCTYYGNSFWTGRSLDEHNGWKWWTPIQPYYSSRGIALHEHPEVSGHPIGHGCVRMDEPNAKRIHDFSNGERTNVTIDGRAAPVACDVDSQCGATTGGAGDIREESKAGVRDSRIASESETAVAGLEGLLS